MRAIKIISCLLVLLVLLSACKGKAPEVNNEELEMLSMACKEANFTASPVQKTDDDGRIAQAAIFYGKNEDEVKKYINDGCGFIAWYQYESEEAAKKDYEKVIESNNFEVKNQEDGVYFIAEKDGKFRLFTTRGNMAIYVLPCSTKYYDNFIKFIEAADYPLP